MKFPNWIIGSMTASLLLATPIITHAEDAVVGPVGFLVSLQDDSGNHICNGTYIGNSQILTDAYCKQSAVISFPPIITPIDPPVIISPTPGTLALVQDSEVMSQLTNAMPAMQDSPMSSAMIQATPDTDVITSASLNGEATHAVFLLPNGDSAPIPLERDFFYTKKDMFPVTGSEMILTATSVPEGVVAITMATEVQTTELLEDSNTQFTLVGKYITGNEKVTQQEHVISDQCYNLSTKKYQQSLCFTPDSGSYCISDSVALGAPLIANINGHQPLLIGVKPINGCGFFQNQGSSFSASARLVSWVNLQGLKQQGLNVVSAFEFGEFKKRSHHELTITFKNESDTQKFDLNDFHMNEWQAMSVTNNNCETLLPLESCSVSVHTSVPESINYMEVLNFNALGTNAGIFVSLNGYQDRKFKSDQKSTWRVSGWKNVRESGFSHPRLNSHLITQDAFSSRPTITRNEYVDGPTKVNVTYRTSGSDFLAFMVLKQRKSLKDNSQLLSLGGFMPGTNGEWRTGVLDITEPGRYSLTLQRAVLSVVGLPLEDLEVRDVCIGECEN
ncbi:MAG: hypothetical protein V7785_10330 [Bermanella sp.]